MISFVEGNPLGRSQHLTDFRFVQGQLDRLGAEGVGLICCFGLNIRGVFRVGQERACKDSRAIFACAHAEPRLSRSSSRILFEFLFLFVGQIKPIPKEMSPVLPLRLEAGA